jgi:hypothetical protein
MEKGKVVHHDAAGMADIAKGRAMEKDALFWIASMTKSVNGSGAPDASWMKESSRSMNPPQNGCRNWRT